MSETEFEPWTIDRLRAEVMRQRLLRTGGLDFFDGNGCLRCYWNQWHGWFRAKPTSIGQKTTEVQALHDINTLQLCLRK